MTADELRAEMSKLYERSKEALQAFGTYSQQMAALSWEYHRKRLSEAFPGAALIEDSLTVVVDLRQTPKSLDTLLASAKSSALAVKQVRLDRANGKAYLHTQ